MKEHYFSDLLKKNEYDIVTEFSNCFFNMRYDEAMQIIGIMKAMGLEDARRLEVMLYFEQGNYGKVRQLFKEEVVLGTEEKEFYFVTLLELGLDEELAVRIDEIEIYEKKHCIYRPITYECYLYMIWLLSRQNKADDVVKKIRYTRELQSYFSRKYPWCIVESLADIYLLNEERLRLKDAGVDLEEIESIDKSIYKQFDGLRKIYYEADTFYSFVEEEKTIPIDLIAFVAKNNCIGYVGPRGAGIYDIVHLMELYRRLSSNNLGIIILTYKNKLEEAVKNNNEFVIEFIKHTYLAALNTTSSENTYMNTLREIIGEVPFLNAEIYKHKDDNIIMSILTPKGRFAYKAALLQYSYSIEHDYGGVDAGMLCLSYMRILELEVSQRIISPLAEYFDEIKNAYDTCLHSCQDEGKRDSLSNQWSYIVENLGKVKRKEIDGFMMGAICALFDRMKVKKYKDKNQEKVRYSIDKYLSKILSDEGNKNRKTIQSIFSAKNREKFRNPPAHTRYVGINTALECKSFVESNLIYLNSWIRKGVN